MSCEYHLKYCRDSFEQNESWAIKLFHTWTQFSSKFTPKTIINFGPFTECMNYHCNLNSTSSIQGQHCMITYSSIMLHDFDEYSNHHGFAFEEEMFMFKNGLCLPSSCSLAQVQNFTKYLLQETNFVAIRTFCQTNEPQSPYALDHFVIFTIGFLALMTALSTFYDFVVDAKIRTAGVVRKCFIAFSVRENLMNLLAFSSSINDDSIDCLNGMKVLAALWIIIGHRMDMMIENPAIMSLFMSFGERMILSAAQMFSSVVDTFFVISGILVTQKCLRLFREKKFNFLKFSLSRFVRFVPSLGIVFMLFMSSLSKKLVSGPQMLDLQEEQEGCRQYWLGSLLLMRNFNDNLCLRHTWYTSTDFQLFILSPSIIYGLFKLGRSFLKIIAFIVLMGQINIFILKYFYMRSSDEFYYQTHYRFSPWFIGVMLGYIMFTSRIHFWKAKTRLLGWMIASFMLLTAEYFTNFQKDYLFDAIFEATHRISWSVFIAWIIFYCHHLKSGGYLKILLEHRFWQPLSKMCYSIYLVHYVIVLLSVVNMKTPYPFSLAWMLTIIFYDVSLSLFIAFIFFLLVEAPFSKLTKHILFQ